MAVIEEPVDYDKEIPAEEFDPRNHIPVAFAGEGESPVEGEDTKKWICDNSWHVGHLTHPLDNVKRTVYVKVGDVDYYDECPECNTEFDSPITEFHSEPECPSCGQRLYSYNN